MLEVGTGTGCIGITLALELPHSRGLLLEYSAGALPVAARNIRSLHAADRLALVRGDMFMPPLMPRGLDVLVSNPPYIAAAEEGEVMAEVLRHEPHSALFSGQDGLRHLRAVIRAGRQALKPGGLIVMEHGYRQGGAVRRLLAEAGYRAPRTEQDLAGLDRCTWAGGNGPGAAFRSPCGTRHRGRGQALRSVPPVSCVHLYNIFPSPLPAAACTGRTGPAFRPAAYSAGHAARPKAGHGRKNSLLPG